MELWIVQHLNCAHGLLAARMMMMMMIMSMMTLSVNTEAEGVV